MVIGKYEHRFNCRGCRSENLIKILDLGDMPLAGGYLFKADFKSEKSYPLILYYCKDCHLVQLLDVVNKEVLFTDYRYLSSSTETLRRHFEDYASWLKVLLNKGDLVVEVGCNDGVFLDPLARQGLDAIGVEPAYNVAEIARRKGLRVLGEYFTCDTAKKILAVFGRQAKAILGSNVFAHIDDMDEVLSAVKLLLHKHGIFSLEVHYLPHLIQDLQYDSIYHEHYCYYSLISLSNMLKRFGLKVFDAQILATHGGLLRIYACLDDREEEFMVKDILKQEREQGFDSVEPYLDFGFNVIRQKETLKRLLKSLKDKGMKIAGYGAPGRGNTLLNYCGIDTSVLDYIVDMSPSRYGRYTPGTHIPIYKPDIFRQNPPDYALMLAWTYKDEIVLKEKWFTDKGGKWIIPLPKVEII